MDEKKKVPPARCSMIWATAGYWGLLVDKQHGGSGAPFRRLCQLSSPRWRWSTAPWPVWPRFTAASAPSIRSAPSAIPEQKQRFLPQLASGKRLSAFALTEPERRFGPDGAPHPRPSRTATSMWSTAKSCSSPTWCPAARWDWCCLIDKRPSVLIVDLPDQENEQFQLKKYGLWALKHTYNQGIIF